MTDEKENDRLSKLERTISALVDQANRLESQASANSKIQRNLNQTTPDNSNPAVIATLLKTLENLPAIIANAVAEGSAKIVGQQKSSIKETLDLIVQIQTFTTKQDQKQAPDLGDYNDEDDPSSPYEGLADLVESLNHNPLINALAAKIGGVQGSVLANTTTVLPTDTALGEEPEESPTSQAPAEQPEEKPRPVRVLERI